MINFIFTCANLRHCVEKPPFLWKDIVSHYCSGELDAIGQQISANRVLVILEVGTSRVTLTSSFGLGGGEMIFRLGPAVISRFIRKLRGSSQSILAEADDGEMYVVKFLNNLQGPNVLFNEAMGTELYQRAMLPVPRCRRLMLTAAFLDENPSCYMDSPEGPVRPAAGLCFGSHFLEGKYNRVYELLPGNYYRRLTNIDDFWVAWLLDACACHAENRQALFPSALRGAFYAVFIDHGHMFGGPSGETSPSFGVSRYLDPRLYGCSTAGLARRLTSSALKLDVDSIWAKAMHLPDQWITETGLHQLSECLNLLSSRAIVECVVEGLLEWRPLAELPYGTERTIGHYLTRRGAFAASSGRYAVV